ncbi:MAG: hypothetical protein ABFD46_04885 [Armatimonadota bacterium]
MLLKRIWVIISFGSDADNGVRLTDAVFVYGSLFFIHMVPVSVAAQGFAAIIKITKVKSGNMHRPIILNKVISFLYATLEEMFVDVIVQEDAMRRRARSAHIRLPLLLMSVTVTKRYIAHPYAPFPEISGGYAPSTARAGDNSSVMAGMTK